MNEVETNIKYNVETGVFDIWFTSGSLYFERVGSAKTFAEAGAMADKRYTEVINERAKKAVG